MLRIYKWMGCGFGFGMEISARTDSMSTFGAKKFSPASGRQEKDPREWLALRQQDHLTSAGSLQLCIHSVGNDWREYEQVAQKYIFLEANKIANGHYDIWFD